MGSANGRHRRPRQAPALVVAAGVTGSAIAIPLLGASGATAADAGTWDRVAECESGGMWSADLGNGYYGGLQFSQETWSAYGGTEFAPRADLASRSQQISVAEKVLDDQGPKAWPSCAVISGLAVDGSLPGVDPGTSPAPDPTSTPTDEADVPDEAGESGESGEVDESGKGDESKGEKGDPTDKGGSGDAERGGGAPDSSVTPSTPPSSGTPDATGPSTAPDASKSQGGKHRGTPAPEEAGAGQGDGPRGSGRHASRGDGDARGGGAATAGAYTVQPGDNLWAIADAQELPGGWSGLYETNKDLLGSDPDLILPGQNLDLGLDQAAGQAAPKGAEGPVEEPAAN
ncbi:MULTISPECIES: transglycosylase family protein [Streptomyces]|uniref:transglycosylase family protein n=2 Tax=Streptomyces TaxID=1883 RepID=UPI0004C911B3|nr:MULTISPECIES: transglycosylase family protein [Streptomyces]MDX2919710.1 transglycosylase family protein [Streptomyces sp. NE06-03C]MDX3735435.1 transglycosylase family protein [Streptomyces sp. ID01-15D]